MKVDELKSKILQLAIQGKLVEQSQKDKPAFLILEEMKKEKEFIIKEKCLRKEKELPDIVEEEMLFDLPEGWEWSRLPNVAIFQEGPGILAKDFRESGIPLIRLSGMQSNVVSLDGCNYLDEKMVNDKWKHFKLDLNDIVISSSASMGKVAIVEASTVGCIPYTGLIRFKLFKGLLDKYFIYFMQSPDYINQIDAQKSGTTIKHYGPTHLKNMIIPIPPLEEQKRIVNKIDELFSIIDELNQNKEEMLKNICHTRNKVLQLAMQGKLVEQCEDDEPVAILLKKIAKEKELLIKEKKIKKEKPLSEITEEEKEFDIPNGWEWTKLGSISEKIHYGYTASAEAEDTGVKLLRITDIQNNKVNWDTVPFCRIEENKLNTSKLFGNDILIARTGGTIGKSFIVKNIVDTAVFASYLIRVKSLKSINPEFIKLFLESPFYWRQLQDKSQGTGQPNVNAVSLSNLVLPLPPSEVQKRIIDKVDEIMSYLDELEKTILEKDII